MPLRPECQIEQPPAPFTGTDYATEQKFSLERFDEAWESLKGGYPKTAHVEDAAQERTPEAKA